MSEDRNSVLESDEEVSDVVSDGDAKEEGPTRGDKNGNESRLRAMGEGWETLAQILIFFVTVYEWRSASSGQLEIVHVAIIRLHREWQ